MTSPVTGPGLADDDGLEPPRNLSADIPDAPPPEIRYRRAMNLRESIPALWRSRAIIWSLTVRDLRSTYNQEVLGIAWALLTPVTLMVVFTFLAGRFGGGVPTGGIWYPIFAYVGLLPWTFFSGSVSSGGTSLIGNALLNKVYAPREVFPISEILASIVNALCATIALALLFLLDGSWPSATSFWAIPLLVILLIFSTGITLLVSCLMVYLRDMRHALPLMLQLGLFLTPIIYGLSEIPAKYRDLYVAANPLGGIIDGMRRCVLYDKPPVTSYTIIAFFVSCVWLFGSYALFKRLETGFADVS
ncbi:MAG: ABC transporter permease [Acidimicrobiia bacterium]